MGKPNPAILFLPTFLTQTATARDVFDECLTFSLIKAAQRCLNQRLSLDIDEMATEYTWELSEGFEWICHIVQSYSHRRFWLKLPLLGICLMNIWASPRSKLLRGAWISFWAWILTKWQQNMWELSECYEWVSQIMPSISHRRFWRKRPLLGMRLMNVWAFPWSKLLRGAWISFWARILMKWQQNMCELSEFVVDSCQMQVLV